LKVAVHRIELASLGKMGCLLGALAAFLPSLLCGLLAFGLAGIVRRWLENWQKLTINVLGQEIATFDLVQFLNLDGVLSSLQVLGSVSVLGLIVAVLALALISGALLAAIIILVGLAYNLLSSATGGVVLELNAAGKQDSRE
jgi:hypothetical protein